MSNILEFKTIDNWTSHFLPFPLVRLRIEVGPETFAIPSLVHRGRFGSQLLSQSCQFEVSSQAPACSGCPYRTDCYYTRLFKPAALSERSVPDASPPLVFSTRSQQGRDYLEVTLFNNEASIISQVSSVLETLGFGSVEYEQFIESGDWRPTPVSGSRASQLLVPPAPEKIAVQFLTPTRLRRRGQWVTAQQMELSDFLYALYRRYKSLSYQYGTPLNWDLRQLGDDTRTMMFDEKYLCWADARRSTTKKVVEHSGVVGMATIKRDFYEAYWPIIWAGQFIHIGKGAAHGLGRYRISVITSL